MTREELLKIYENYSNEDLRDSIISVINEYGILTKSELVAERILETYGIKFYYIHENFKRNVKRMILCARIRGIVLPENANYVEITLEDVIERISENESFQECMFKNYDFKGISSLYEEVINKCKTIMDGGKVFK